MTIMTNDGVILRTNDQKNRPRDFFSNPYDDVPENSRFTSSYYNP